MELLGQLNKLRNICYRAITQELHFEKIYLFIQKTGACSQNTLTTELFIYFFQSGRE